LNILSDDKPVTKTFRFNKKHADILTEEAEKRGLSESAILREILARYVDNDRFYQNEQPITLHATTLTSLLDGLTEEEVLDAGRNAGKIRARDNFMTRGMAINYESLKWFINTILTKYSGWFTVNLHEMEDMYVFHLRHRLNHNWSLFIHAYLESMVQNIMNIDVEAEVLDGTVTLRIPIKKT
jgi:hypothetical protein